MAEPTDANPGDRKAERKAARAAEKSEKKKRRLRDDGDVEALGEATNDDVANDGVAEHTDPLAPSASRDPIDRTVVAFTMRELLSQLGVPPSEIDEADSQGTAQLLALERAVLNGPPRYTQAEVYERSGLDGELVSRLWRALGFPSVDDDVPAFTDDDVAVLGAVAGIIDAGAVDEDLVVQMTRVIGSSIGRIATAQVDAIDDALARARQQGEFDDVDPDMLMTTAALRSAHFLPIMPRVLEYVWRRQLAAAARSRMAVVSGETAGEGIVVGFADLVGYTALSQQLSEHELAEVVSRFEGIAYDTVASMSGRVIKLIGDAVMFEAPDPTEGAEIALALADAYRDDEELSDVRVGLAFGPVLRRDGDLYGSTVNLASRIVSVAYPGTVVLGEELFAELEDHEAYEFRKLRSHVLKDIGRVRLWRMRRTGDEEESPQVRSRSRREQRRAWIEQRRGEAMSAAADAAGLVAEDLIDELLTGVIPGARRRAREGDAEADEATDEATDDATELPDSPDPTSVDPED